MAQQLKFYWLYIFLCFCLIASKAQVNEKVFSGKDTVKITYIKKKDGTIDEFKNDQLVGTYRYVNGKKHGKAVEYGYNKEGKVYYKTRGTYVNGLKEGVWNAHRLYYDYEEFLGEVQFSFGKINGYGSYFYQGDTLVEGEFIHGLCQGKCTVYVPRKWYSINSSDSSIDSTYYWAKLEEVNFVDGKREGKAIVFDYDKIFQTGFYKNNLREGQWLELVIKGSFDGQLIKKMHYKKGQLNGLMVNYLEYDYDSEIEYDYYSVSDTQNFVNDTLNGPFVKRNSEGILTQKGQYINGVSQGICGFLDDKTEKNFWYEGGVVDGKKEGLWKARCIEDDCPILMDLSYKNNEINGYVNIYNDGQNLTSSFLYHNNKPISVRYVLNNQFVDNLTIKVDTSTYQKVLIDYNKLDTFIYFQLKHQSIKKIDSLDQVLFQLLEPSQYVINISNFKYDGLYLKYVGDLKIEELNYKNNTYDGANKIWLYDQNVRLEYEYITGLLVGEQVYKLSNNKPFSGKVKIIDKEHHQYQIIKVKKGIRQGITDFYDIKTGKKVLSVKFKNGVAVERIEY